MQPRSGYPWSSLTMRTMFGGAPRSVPLVIRATKKTVTRRRRLMTELNGLRADCFRSRLSASHRIRAEDVSFQVLHDRLLRGDDPLHEVADGDNSHEFAVRHHWKVADALLGHHSQAF